MPAEVVIEGTKLRLARPSDVAVAQRVAAICNAVSLMTTGAPTGVERMRCGPGPGWGASASRAWGR